jgi:hypothetical protein
MKNIYSLILAILISTVAFSQNTSCDNIIYKNGDELSVQVIEISESIVKYKKCDNIGGPTYSESISKVFMIKYKNGTKDILNQTEYVSKVEYKTSTEANITNSNATQESSSSIDWQTKHKIGFNIGHSAAIGLFGSYDDDDGDEDYGAGFAKGGFSYNLSYQYSFTDNFAATFVWGGGANQFNAEEYVALFADSDVNGLAWDVEADPYTAGYVMIGLKASVGNEKVKGYINPVFGRCAIVDGDVKVTASSGGSSSYFTLEETDPFPGLIYGGSVGADFRVSELININLDLLFLHSNIEDVERTLDYDDPSLSDIDFTDGKQKYSTANFTVGIGFNF